MKQAIREYKQAYATHQANIKAYAWKRCEWSVVAMSAKALKLAQARALVEIEAAQVGG